MISDERIVSYINSLESDENDFLKNLREEAIRDNVPIIRREMESFLKVIIALRKPCEILELGSAVGYSAILMSEYGKGKCNITTIENYEKRIPIAKKNFAKAQYGDKIKLICGDALEEISKMENTYDMIFIDAAKGQYINYLPEAIRLLNKGGVLIADNVLFDGDIFESRYGVVRRNRTIHSRMREFLEAVKNHEQLITSIVPIGDGITFSIKK